MTSDRESSPVDRQEPDPREKVRQFPTTPGVYLMKDAQGRVLYVGKAVNLRSRASSYFNKAAAVDFRTADLVRQIHDIDFISADSEVDAILLEARLVKDIQPPFNQELKDDKTFPYLELTLREDFPRVEFTRKPHTRGTRLYGPFTNAKKLRGAIAALQKIFRFRTCALDIAEQDERWKWFRPCLLYSINQCTAPCNLRISKDDYRRDIERLKLFLDGKKQKLLDELRDDMQQASQNLKYEKAARIRDQLRLLENLSLRGNLDEHVQPEVFFIDPRKGLAGLQKIFKLPVPPRRIEGVDIAHLGGEDTVASLVQFIDGLPFKPGYKRFKIRGVEGVDDFASIREVVGRRFARLAKEGESFPDMLLVDGGIGQLNAALEALRTIGVSPPLTISLAKQEEEIYVPGEPIPRRLSRHSYALRLLQYIRDEAHRFAQHYHHLLRRKATLEE
jgi:excinuclease ABC subunit C